MVNKNKKQCSLGATDGYANSHENKITCSITQHINKTQEEYREDKKQTEERQVVSKENYLCKIP